MKKLIPELIGGALTVWLIYMAYFETGPYTTVILVLISIALKLQTYLLVLLGENQKKTADLIGKIAGIKKGDWR